jgi:DNA-binding MarR family transcriptional regulator
VPTKKRRDEGPHRGNGPSDPTTRIIHALRRLTRALDIHSRRLAAEKDVTSVQLFCMKMLAHDGVDTATEVARKVHLSPSTVVGVLDRLEAKGMIERARDREDRRVVRVVLTRKGRDLIKKTPDPVEDLLRRQSNEVAPGETGRLADAIERLVAALGAEEIDASTPYGELGVEDQSLGK